MKGSNLLPPQSLVQKRLNYDSVSGVFTWAKPVNGNNLRFLGKPAGNVKTNGYITIFIHGYGKYSAHRLAWLYVNGPIPGGMEIDHIDGNPANNAIANLRLATRLQNARNCRPCKNNKLGVRGVISAPNGRFIARAKLNGKQIHLGTFRVLGDAAAARAAFEKENFGVFVRS